MAYLFDTNAISEVLRPKPNPEFAEWVARLPRDQQFTSAVVAGELYAGAYKAGSNKWLERIEQEVLPRVTVLPFDLQTAKHYGRIRSELAAAGTPIGDADTQIAATALRFDLTVVTANSLHFERVANLEVWGFTPGA